MRYKIDYEKRIKEYLESKNKHYTYYIETMGCALNENDSMKYAGILEEMGFSRIEDISKANVVLFNTCCIRENAEEKLHLVWAMISSIWHQKATKAKINK